MLETVLTCYKMYKILVTSDLEAKKVTSRGLSLPSDQGASLVILEFCSKTWNLKSFLHVA